MPDDDAVYEASGRQPDLEELRGLFLGAVGRLAPRVLRSLRRLKVDVAAAQEQLRSYDSALPPEEVPALIPLLNWTRRWNLVGSDSSDPWILDAALKTLAGWQAAAHAHRRLKFVSRGFASYQPDLPPLKLEFRAWDAQIETPDRFRRRIRKELGPLLNDYIESQKVALQETGFRPARLKRRADDHLTWLVSVYVLRKSPMELAKGEMGSGNETALESRRRVIAKEVRKLALRLGLRRPDLPTGGRPRRTTRPR
jgi:hypothetical protein